MKNSLIESFYQAEDYFFRSMSRECLNVDTLTTAYCTGVNLESDNPLYIRKHIGAIEDVLARCKNFYQSNNVPWNVIVTEEYITSDLTQALNKINFSVSGKSVAMAIELNSIKCIIPEDMNIQLVDDKLEQWMLPLGGAFETTDEVTRQYAVVHERALRNKANFHHYTLFKNELPISSLTITWQSSVARISDVGTLPEHQNKGYASQLMQYALNELSDLGAKYCFLEASEVGVSVYQKLGFVALFKNYTYSQT